MSGLLLFFFSLSLLYIFTFVSHFIRFSWTNNARVKRTFMLMAGRLPKGEI